MADSRVEVKTRVGGAVCRPEAGAGSHERAERSAVAPLEVLGARPVAGSVRGPDATYERQEGSWVFRDMVLQDVGFESNSFRPLTHLSFRCEVPTPSVVEGQQIIIIKPHILKHHISALPIESMLRIWISMLNFKRTESLQACCGSSFQR